MRRKRDIKQSDICNRSISSMMFSLWQRCSTVLEKKRHINVGCTKNRKYITSCILSALHEQWCRWHVIHWPRIRSGRDEDVLENALCIPADLFSLGNNMVYETFVFRQGRRKGMKPWPAFLPNHTNRHAHGSVLSWILQSKCKLCVITYYPGSEQALCKPELVAYKFLNTKWVVVPAEIQTQHRKNNVQFISIQDHISRKPSL